LPLILLIGVGLSGCATSSIESRKKERASAYASLSPDFRALVDSGQIKVGMDMEAVYIAWGKPSQTLLNEDQNGSSTVWLYEGGWMQESRYWSPHHIANYYQPMVYVRAEIVFVNGQVRSWRTLPQPVY
jgi:hypothetical protein